VRSNHRLQRVKALQNAEHGERADGAIGERKVGSTPDAAVHHFGGQVVKTRHRRGRRVETEPGRDLFASLPQCIAGHGSLR